MFLIFEGFQHQNVLISILFSMKEFYPFMAKITPDVNNSF